MAEFWDIYDKNGNRTDHFHERGKPMQKGDYHLVVHVWIINSNCIIPSIATCKHRMNVDALAWRFHNENKT